LFQSLYFALKNLALWARIFTPWLIITGSRIYVNKDQYFEGVGEELWKYQIGGYQVCNKWLKDRKERILSLDEIKHYCKIVTAIKKTIGVQKNIDNIYLEVEKEIIEF
jgi:hypothetical protein